MQIKQTLNKLIQNPKKLTTYILLLLIIIYIIIGLHNSLETTNYTYTSERIPDAFDGYKIVQISDLHTKSFGKDNEKLIKAIKACSPDIIAITGDLINDDIDDLKELVPLFEAIQDIAPAYFVCGNHDMPSWEDYLSLTGILESYNITTIDNQTVTLTKNDDSINMSGLFSYKEATSVTMNSDKFNILLYHYANHFENIVPLGYDLIIAGHTHGGIIRLPIVGGVIANDGSILPKYSSGMYTKEGSTLISSRGLGDSYIPRFYNDSELVCITLNKKK